MTDETQRETKTARRVECPSCGKKAKRLSTVTLGALLNDEFAERFARQRQSCRDTNGKGCQPIGAGTGWRFCDSPDCEVVYFSEQGDTTFTKPQLKVPVGVKELAGERPLCYCFGHSVASIKEELRTKGRSDALQDIRAKMKDPGCRCETENPSGSCCLGSVARGIKIAEEELAGSNAPPPASPATSSSNRGELIAKIGTVVSAILASACCWLPLVLLALGVSGAGMASTLGAYRPLFMVVTFAFLGAAFYLTYRPRKAAGGAHACCGSEAGEVEDRCVPASRGHFSMMTVNKAMLWVVTVLAVLFLFFPKYVGFFMANRQAEGDITATKLFVSKTTIAIDGMTCEGCSVALEKAIQGVPGVLSAKVDFKNKQAEVSTEACCPFPKDEILKAVTEAGFSGSVAETK